MMKRALILCGAVVAAMLTPDPPAVQAATLTCDGKPVTIVASAENWRGTSGDDVVLVELIPINFPDDFYAFGGNDTICLTVPPGGSAHGIDRMISAGSGNDTVISLLPPGARANLTRVDLGRGNDSFTGNNTGESVAAESWFGDLFDRDSTRPGLTGPQTDTISGALRVFTTAPFNRANRDKITVTADRAFVHVSGPMASDGLLDFTAAGKVSLSVQAPALLDRKAKRVLVNTRTRKITSGNRTALTWRGDVRTFMFGAPAWSEKIDFQGSDRAENVIFQVAHTGHLDLGGGDDRLAVNQHDVCKFPEVADGGAGRDQLSVSSDCRALVIRLDGRSRSGTSTGMVRGFERADGNSATRVTLVGTERADKLRGWADDELTLVGRGGADTLRVDIARNAVLDGGRGADRILADGRHFRAMGGPGNDYIRAGNDWYGREEVHQRFLLGGPGHDRLDGSRRKYSERLIGGPGRDVANGREGSLDYCLAEINVECELPK